MFDIGLREIREDGYRDGAQADNAEIGYPPLGRIFRQNGNFSTFFYARLFKVGSG